MGFFFLFALQASLTACTCRLREAELRPLCILPRLPMGDARVQPFGRAISPLWPLKKITVSREVHG